MIPYIHRDISWLSFNYRVLQEAKDPSVPLFERVKFLAIYSSNLDEFFRVRVANHRNLVRVGKKTQKRLNFEPKEILQQILNIVNTQQEEVSAIFEEKIFPDLAKQGIRFVRRKNLSEEQENYVKQFFSDNLLPFVQPVLLVGKKIKPFLNNRALYLAIHMLAKDDEDKKSQYGLVKIPSDHIPRFVEIPSLEEDSHYIMMLDDIVRHNIRHIFPGYDIMDTYSIKLTRDAELYIDDEYSGNLLSKIRKSLAKRDVGPASRLVYDRKMPDHLLNFLMEVFDLEEFDLLPEGRYHNNSDFFKLPSFGRSHLIDPPLPPLPIPALEQSTSILKKIKKKDWLIHPPYHSYESVVRFFEEAAKDPSVTHIKIIQYRVAKVSRIMNALMTAVKSGKQVSAFIEIKARFDEEANLIWGERLEEAGVTVNYSMPGLKVHSKMALVRRLEKGKPILYTHFSTGNFHEETAKLYSDIGIFTADSNLTAEAARLFSYLETKSLPGRPFKHIGVGKFNLNELLMSLIDQEVNNAKEGKVASIILKMNSLQDSEMIEKLYHASQQGVKIKLIVRGICSLVPGIKSVSENIEAISIVDRFLEHARVFIFHNDGDNKIYLSSADWMVRNLHYRIETMVPVYDENIKEQIIDLINIQLNDNVKARKFDSKMKNRYKKNNSDLATRSQIETYYYIKRITELSEKEGQQQDVEE